MEVLKVPLQSTTDRMWTLNAPLTVLFLLQHFHILKVEAILTIMLLIQVIQCLLSLEMELKFPLALLIHKRNKYSEQSVLVNDS